MIPVRLSKNGRYAVELRGIAAEQWICTALDCPANGHIRSYKSDLLAWARNQTLTRKTNGREAGRAAMSCDKIQIFFRTMGRAKFFYVYEGPRIVVLYLAHFLRPKTQHDFRNAMM